LSTGGSTGEKSVAREGEEGNYGTGEGGAGGPKKGVLEKKKTGTQGNKEWSFKESGQENNGESIETTNCPINERKRGVQAS